MVDIETYFEKIGDVSAALTFFYLIHKADCEGYVRASYADMGKDLRCSRSTLHKYVRRLADIGVVECRVRTECEQSANRVRTKNTLIYIPQVLDCKRIVHTNKNRVRTECEQSANKNGGKRKVISKSIEERKKDFVELLKPYVEKYGRDMLNDFYRYWSQVNEGGTKMLWEKQKAFEIGKRLVTWKKNDDERRRPQRTADIGMVIHNDEDKFKNEEVW